MFDAIETQLYNSEVFCKFFGANDDKIQAKVNFAEWVHHRQNLHVKAKFAEWEQNLQTNQNENISEINSKNLYKKHINNEVISENGFLNRIDYDNEILTYLFDQTVLLLPKKNREEITKLLDEKSLKSYHQSENKSIPDKIAEIVYYNLSAIDVAKAVTTFSIVFAACGRLVNQIATPIIYAGLAMATPHLPIRFVAVVVGINRWKVPIRCSLFIASFLAKKENPKLNQYVIVPFEYLFRYTFSLNLEIYMKMVSFSYSVAKYFVPNLVFVDQRVRLYQKQFSIDQSIGSKMVWIRQKWINEILISKRKINLSS